MLADFPGDFQYVLGLQEAVVVGMADGFAQASGRPAVANLHTAPGVGNAMGAIFNAHANHSPLLITAGQQARAQMTLQANLTNRDATRLPHPLVKWSHEPPRPEDVPLALAHGLHLAALPPQGPVFVSIPMDDWDAEMPEAEAREVVARGIDGRAVASPDSIRRLAEKLDSAENPVLVAGPDVDSSGGWDTAVALAERQRLPVWASPATGGVRLGFPEGHPNFRGVLPPAIGPVAQTLEGHDLILVLGSLVFPYYPHIPGPLLPEGATLVAITSDPDEAARAPMGYAIVADVGLSLAALLEAVPESSRPGPEPNPGPEEIPAEDPLNSSTVHSALAEVFPEDGIVVLESPASTLALRNQLRLSRPGSYYFSAGGGLGFGLAASIGADQQSGRDLPPRVPLPRHARAVFVGDFLSPLDDIERQMSNFAEAGVRGHILQVLDPAEETLPYSGRIHFEGLKGEEPWLLSRAERVRQDYIGRLERQRDGLRALARAFNWTFDHHRCDKPAESALLSLYMALADPEGV